VEKIAKQKKKAEGGLWMANGIGMSECEWVDLSLALSHFFFFQSYFTVT